MSTRIDRLKAIELAERYIKAGKLREAIVEYEKLAEGDDQDIGMVNMIGDLYVRLGQTAPAIRAFQRVAEEYEKRGLYSQALAIYKKITKIVPENPDFCVKLADLFSLQGFAAEARQQYLRTAERFERDGQLLDAVKVYEKLVKLDKEDLEAKRKLVSLYREQGRVEGAVEQLNEMAELKLARDAPAEAEDLLEEARAMDPFQLRTLVNLVEIRRKAGRLADARAAVEAAVEAGQRSPQILSLLGNLLFEMGESARAEELFTSLLADHPTNVNARIKLGRLTILDNRLDAAYAVLEPLVNNLVKKQKVDKAVGLLGLILGDGRIHLPTLEKLASIYRADRDVRKLEIIDRVVAQELEAAGEKAKAMAVLAELTQLRPDDADLSWEHRRLRKDLGLSEPETPEADERLKGETVQREIDEALEQAQLYTQQGLMRNAKRILENLRQKYPDEPAIEKRLDAMEKAEPLDEEEIRRRVEKTAVLETQIRGDRPGRPDEAPAGRRETRKKTPQYFSPGAVDEEKISTADIFTELDLAPILPSDGADRTFYDLDRAVEDERRLMASVIGRQARGTTSQFEKELSTIVQDFKRGLQDKVSHEDYEIHFQLGIAFMEQGLYTEAIEELSVASRDKGRALECYSIISRCHRKKRNSAEAEKWLKKALLLAREGTESYFAVEFELARLYEDLQDRENALSLYKEVRNWNPAYRDVEVRVGNLEKSPAGTPA